MGREMRRAGDDVGESCDRATEWAEGNPDVEGYHDRHGTGTMQILTVQTADEARRVVSPYASRIQGKRVVEVGAGVGFVALEMARHAAHVYAVELDPIFTWAFTEHLYRAKPANLTWIMGRAQDVQELLRDTPGGGFDVAVCFTRSDTENMRRLCEAFAPEVIWGAEYLYLIKSGVGLP
jgi:predicted O-methyltransferase YrrM